jgi:hypothetical protein
MSMFFLEPLLVYVVFLLFVAGNSSLIVSCSFFKLLFSVPHLVSFVSVPI